MQETYWQAQWKGFKDYFRWKEIGFLIILYTVLFLIFSWWGIIGALVLDWLCHLNGGMVIDVFGDFPPKKEIKTIKKTFYCNLCKKEETIYLEDKR